MGAQRAVARRKGGERLLQEPRGGATDREPRVEQESAERGHVAERSSREQLRIGRAPRAVDRALERQQRAGAVVRAPLRVAEAQQQIPAPFAGAAPRGAEELERAAKLDGCLLVSEHDGRAISRVDEALHGLAASPRGARKR